MPLLPFVLLVSGLTAPPLEPTDIPLPDELRQAQSLGYRRPDDCVQLSRRFLRREMQAELPAISRNHAAAGSRLGRRTLGQSFRAYLLQGLCLERQEQTTDALANFEQAEQLAHRYRLPRLEALALYHRARLLALTLQRTEDAQPVLSQLQSLLQTRLQRDQELVIHQGLLRAAIAIDQQQLSEASLQLSRVEALQLAIPSTALSAWIRALEGDLQLARQQDDRALTSYAEAIDLAREAKQPLLPALLAGKMGELFHHRGDLSRAIHYQEQAVEQFAQLGNPLWLNQSLLELATLNREAGDPNLALAQLFNALDLQRGATPPLAKAWLQLQIGQTYLQIPNLPQARIYLQAALRTFLRLGEGSGSQQTQLLLAELYLQQRQPNQAIQLLETVRQQIKPPARTPPELYHRLARAYEQQGLLQQALATYKLYSASEGQQQQGWRRLDDKQFRERIALADKEHQLKALALNLDQLQSDSRHYRWWSTVASLLALGLGIGLLRLWRRHGQRGRELHDCRQRLEIHAPSGLANQLALARELGPAAEDEAGRWYPEDRPQHPLNQRQHFVLLRPLGLTGLAERRGQLQARRILHALIERLHAGLPASDRLYALSDAHLLCILPGQDGTGLHRQLAQLFTQLAPWLDAEGLDPRLAVGIIGRPFLARSTQALKEEQLVELGYLALGAAVQLCERTATSQWVELTAIDCQQAAFFNGNVRERALEAIDLGLVKAGAASGKPLIDWADLR